MIRKISSLGSNAKSLTRNKLALRKNLNLVKRAGKKDPSNFYELAVSSEKDIISTARACFEDLGYFPISFSSPRKFREFDSIKTETISNIVPFQKYNFLNQDDYYSHYGISYLAITQKKGGYDCFRHLEIISSGTVPLFLKSNQIPPWTMIHYPKVLFSTVESRFSKNLGVPSNETIKHLTEFANNHLTSEAMCLYFSQIAELALTRDQHILFVDETLHAQPDYLSIFNFIGLKQVYGSRVVSFFPEPDYVYTDSQMDTSALYGRGFGYTKVLERESTSEPASKDIRYIVISNLEKDWGLIVQFQRKYPDASFLLFWGGDTVISAEVLEVTTKIHRRTLFVREIF